MKITINQKNLLKALVTTERIVSRNPSLPILNNILLKTENGRLKVAATNLEIGINYYIGAKIDETGEIAVPARIFSDFIGNLGDEKITLVTKNNILSLSTNKYKTQILGLDPKDFPIIPKIKGDNFSVISAKVLKNSLNAVFDSVAVSETRPELSGVYMNFALNYLTFTATDSFRLTEKVSEIKHKEKNSLIIPRSTVIELIKLASDIQEDIAVKLGDNQVAFLTDNIEMVSRVIDGNYPDYRKVIPDKFISKVLIKKNELEKNVRLAGLFSSSTADIRLSCDEKKVSLTAKNSDKGDIQVSIDAVLKNEPFDISINHHYLLDGLKIMPTENIVIEYTGQGSPLVLRPEQDSKDLVYLIMPLRN